MFARVIDLCCYHDAAASAVAAAMARDVIMASVIRYARWSVYGCIMLRCYARMLLLRVTLDGAR